MFASLPQTNRRQINTQQPKTESAAEKNSVKTKSRRKLLTRITKQVQNVVTWTTSIKLTKLAEDAMPTLTRSELAPSPAPTPVPEDQTRASKGSFLCSASEIGGTMSEGDGVGGGRGILGGTSILCA